jgi:hypothetical protein
MLSTRRMLGLSLAAILATAIVATGCKPPAPTPGAKATPSGSSAASASTAATPTGSAAVLPTPTGPALLTTPTEGPSVAPTKSASPTAAATATASQAAAPGGWRDLFDGKTLTNWKVTEFDNPGKVHVENGELIFDISSGTLTGVTWAGGDLPRMNYEVTCEAKRMNGSDFFLGLTFPYLNESASLIAGGWGGELVGISSLDGHDASDNETTSMKNFETDHWYKFRVVVQPDHIEAWIDNEQVVDCDVRGRRVDVRSEVEASKPLGLAAFMTQAAYRNLRIRPLAK